MEMLRLRREGWQEDPETAPNFVTLTGDRSKLPGWIEPGSDEEDGYLRTCFAGVMRQLNQEERRQGRPRIQYVGVVERGKRTGNWHLHLVTDREIHVKRWRRVAQAHGLGKVVKAKRLKGARGAAVYLAKYLSKESTASVGRRRRVLLHSRGCLPSLEMWRWRRATRKAYRNAWSWTPERLEAQRELMRAEKDARRLELEADCAGPLSIRGSARTADGGRQLIVNRILQRKFCSPVRRPQDTGARSSGRGAASTEDAPLPTMEPPQSPHSRRTGALRRRERHSGTRKEEQVGNENDRWEISPWRYGRPRMPGAYWRRPRCGFHARTEVRVEWSKDDPRRLVMPLEPYHPEVGDPHWADYEWRPALNADGSAKIPDLVRGRSSRFARTPRPARASAGDSAEDAEPGS